MKQFTIILSVFLISMKSSLTSGQQMQIMMVEVPEAPISLAEVPTVTDDNQKLEGLSDAEIYFKYKTEKTFEGKIKNLMAEMVHDFDHKLSTALDIHSDTFRIEFEQIKKKEFDEAKLKGGSIDSEQIDSPKTIETLNKTWEDIIVLVTQVHEIVQNMTILHRSQLEEYFFSDDKGQGHEKFSEQFMKVYNQFEADNKQFLKVELPKLSMVKQNKRIHKLTNKMIKEVKKGTVDVFEVYEANLIEESKYLLVAILEEFVSNESHTNWREQTKQFYDDMFDENKSPEQ